MIDDLLFLQSELTGDLLDHFETEAPGHLEARAATLARPMEAAHQPLGAGTAGG